MVLTREEKRALLLLLGCFVAGAALYLWREGALPFGKESVGQGKIRVKVAGAVLNPLDVAVPAGTRVEDVFRESLPLENADLAAVPMGKKLDGDAEFDVRLKGEAVYSRKLNINTATQGELEKLPGVGPHVAEKILEARQVRRKFYKTEDLKEVPGIGEKKYEALKEFVEAR